MRVTASLHTGLDTSPRRRNPEDSGRQDPPRPASLPAVIPSADRAVRDSAPSRVRPPSPLLAQLVAGSENLPVARMRRRADPGTTAELYRSVAAGGPLRPRTTRIF